MVISTDKLELVVIEKSTFMHLNDFDIHDLYEMYFICMCATIAAFLLTFKVKSLSYFFLPTCEIF